MLRQEACVAGHDDTQHGVVGDHHVRLPGSGARQLREALGAKRTRGPQALGLRHRDLGPGAVRDAGDQVVAVTGIGGRGPLTQPHHLLAEPGPSALPDALAGGGGSGEEPVRLGVGGVAALETVAAHVVLPALEQGHAGPGPGDGLDGVGGQGCVLGEDLALEGQGGRRDHGPLPGGHGVGHGGHQVAQGLAGAGARLDQEVGAGLDGVGHGPGHGHLALARAAAHPGDGLGQGALRRRARLATRGLHLRRRRAVRRCRRMRGRLPAGPVTGPGTVVTGGAWRRRRAHAPGSGPAAGSPPAPRSAPNSSAASAASTRATTWVPDPVCSITPISPSAWTRETRSPRE